MGQISLIHDESSRSAHRVVNYFAVHLDDEQVVEAFPFVRNEIARSMRDLLTRLEHEAKRLGRPWPMTPEDTP